jgi:hypothetical protein
MTELMQVFDGRPAFIERGGGRVFISPHDQQHRHQRAEWKGRLKQAHPDMGGSAPQFRRLHRLYQQWLQSEADWYALHGIEPPMPIVIAITPPSQSPIAIAPAVLCRRCQVVPAVEGGQYCGNVCARVDVGVRRRLTSDMELHRLRDRRLGADR